MSYHPGVYIVNKNTQARYPVNGCVDIFSSQQPCNPSPQVSRAKLNHIGEVPQYVSLRNIMTAVGDQQGITNW